MLVPESFVLPLSAAAMAALSSFGAGFGVLQALRAWRVLDQPNARSSHAVPTPRGGGLGIMAVTAAGWVWVADASRGNEASVLLAGAVVLGVVSFLDDRRPLPWRLRFGVQIVTAAALVAVLGTGTTQPLLPALVLAGVGVLLVVGYANAFNFMDGINGLAAGQAVVSGLGLAGVAVAAGVSVGHPAVGAALLVAGASAGFLPHNFPRARMFMGDVGSVPLGFLLMGITLWLARDAGWRWLPVLGVVHLNFVLDTSVTLIRRARRGEVLHQAHREHFYQRLVRAGWSHQRTTLVELILNGGLIALATAGAEASFAWGCGASAGAGAVWLLLFAAAGRALRKAEECPGSC
jgi:UDP-N-acetylmuramyl pentapeptide phosphotransferase/UDP-N-acetylglucosamine-1-phosphate transferase